MTKFLWVIVKIAIILILEVSSFRFIPRRVGFQQLSNIQRKLCDSGGNEVSEQFGEWGREEIQIQLKETKSKIDNMRADGDTIPEYMLRMLNEFSPDECIPTVEALLPIVAIIGRPNTGKSTIVNKLSNSHKVYFIYLALRFNM